MVVVGAAALGFTVAVGLALGLVVATGAIVVGATVELVVEAGSRSGRSAPRDARAGDNRVEKSTRELAMTLVVGWSGVAVFRRAARLITTRAAHISPAMIFPATRECSCRSPSLPLVGARFRWFRFPRP